MVGEGQIGRGRETILNRLPSAEPKAGLYLSHPDTPVLAIFIEDIFLYIINILRNTLFFKNFI